MIHRHRDLDADGGGVALIHADNLKVAVVPFSNVINGVDCLVSKIRTRCRRVNLAAIYRPRQRHPSMTSQSVSTATNLVYYPMSCMLSLPGQLTITVGC